MAAKPLMKPMSDDGHGSLVHGVATGLLVSLSTLVFLYATILPSSEFRARIRILLHGWDGWPLASIFLGTFLALGLLASWLVGPKGRRTVIGLILASAGVTGFVWAGLVPGLVPQLDTALGQTIGGVSAAVVAVIGLWRLWKAGR